MKVSFSVDIAALIAVVLFWCVVVLIGTIMYVGWRWITIGIILMIPLVIVFWLSGIVYSAFKGKL